MPAAGPCSRRLREGRVLPYGFRPRGIPLVKRRPLWPAALLFSGLTPLARGAASPPLRLDNAPSYSLAGHLESWVDPSGRMTFDEILTPAVSARFRSLPDNMNIGYKVDDLAGKMNILLEAETTAALTACRTSVDSTNYESADRNGQYVYDVEIYKGSPEVVHRAIQGIIFVDAEVTK